MAMVPHERSLVQRMKGKPFVLLGINLDADREELKAILPKQAINWRSWWDGGEKRIIAEWGVESLPTIYLIDQKGIIRFENLNGQELNDAVEKLVAEAESEAK